MSGRLLIRFIAAVKGCNKKAVPSFMRLSAVSGGCLFVFIKISFLYFYLVPDVLIYIGSVKFFRALCYTKNNGKL
jgi:hypothetical protein